LAVTTISETVAAPGAGVGVVVWAWAAPVNSNAKGAEVRPNFKDRRITPPKPLTGASMAKAATDAQGAGSRGGREKFPK